MSSKSKSDGKTQGINELSALAQHGKARIMYTVKIESSLYEHNRHFCEEYDAYCETLAEARRLARSRMRYCRSSDRYNNHSWRDYVRAHISKDCNVVESIYLPFTGRIKYDVN